MENYGQELHEEHLNLEVMENLTTMLQKDGCWMTESLQLILGLTIAFLY